MVHNTHILNIYFGKKYMDIYRIPTGGVEVEWVRLKIIK